MATAAQETAPQPVPRPSRLLAFSEIQRALFEMATLPLASPLLFSAPRGDGHPVMVLPGFMASGRSTKVMRRYLDRLGYDTYCWDLGRNLGPRAIGVEGEHLIDKLHEIHEETGEKVSLVGWSLGGSMSRQLSQRVPDKIRQVITLGSPMRGRAQSTSVWRLYEATTGDNVSSDKMREQMAEIAAAPKVPTTAVYTKADGVVPWQNCQVTESEHSENIGVYGSHCGLGVNGSVLYLIANRLAQAEGEWTPFEAKGLHAAIFPSRD